MREGCRLKEKSNKENHFFALFIHHLIPKPNDLLFLYRRHFEKFIFFSAYEYGQMFQTFPTIFHPNFPWRKNLQCPICEQMIRLNEIFPLNSLSNSANVSE